MKYANNAPAIKHSNPAIRDKNTIVFSFFFRAGFTKNQVSNNMTGDEKTMPQAIASLIYCVNNSPGEIYTIW